MIKVLLNINLLKNINSFMKNSNSLKYLDPNIFASIDNHKELNDMNYIEYYLDYIKSLPELDFNSVVKIAREVYQSFGKEQEFDLALERLINNHDIEPGSLNENDDNCITKASESRLLLTGTCYDVIMLCHEIGHKLRYDRNNSDDIMDSFLFETPPIIMELAASNHLRDNYNINIDGHELRRNHIMSMPRNNNIENKVFSLIIELIKANRFNTFNLYRELIKNPDIVEYLNRTTLEDCFEEGLSSYAYDIGYTLGEYTLHSTNKEELLEMFLKYKDQGINAPFTIQEKIIDNTIGTKGFTID